MADTFTFTRGGGEAWRNPYPQYRELRDDHRVHHQVDGDYWVLSRFEDVFNAARDTETFSSAQGLTTEYGEMERIGLDSEAAPIVMMDPPEHTAFRRLVGRGFTPRRVETIEDDVRAFVRARLDELEANDDIIAKVFKPLPSFVVAHYLGVPVEDRDRFDGWTDAIVAAGADDDADAAALAAADLFGYFTELIERRRREPGDDMVTALVEAELDDEDVPLIKILGFCFTMVTGGNDTTTGLLGVTAELLTAHPDQRQHLVDEPAALANAVEEFLRLASPVQGLARMTTRPVEVAGVEIPAGKKVLLGYAAANRDEREFGPTAEMCDVQRQIDRIMSFGYGPHHCIGAAAARLQARVALEELLARFPNFSVDAAAGRFAGGVHVRRYESLPFAAQGMKG